jgi:hypothetical protein
MHAVVPSLFLLVGLLSGGLFAQAPASKEAPKKEDSKRDDRKEIAALVSEMTKDVNAKKAPGSPPGVYPGDEDALRKLDNLLVEFPNCGPKDRKKIADATAKNLKAVRLPPQGSTEQPRLYSTSVVALGQMREFGVKPLQEAFEEREWKKDIDFRGKILRSLGTTKDPSAVDFLLNVLNSKDYPLIADAATALGNYDGAPEEVRKSIVEKLQKHLNSTQGQANDIQNPGYADLKKKYETISPAMIESLQKLTHQNFREPREWEKWWNDNKSKPWS